MATGRWNEGSSYKDFTVTKSLEIKELNCTLIELIHAPTQAQVLHIANDDPENVFSLSFQTIPDSSDGAAHILEHTVLCGSKKFPVKDPFFSMSRRSLNTYMNALTGSDFTCYPAASQVKKDFYNLLEVYLDAVFHPNLPRMSFLQEGHRLQFHDADDPSTPLEYKGIVFNEMKGSMNSPLSRLHEMIYEALFPDLTYGFNSGGDPKVIPTLTYEKLVDFHWRFYHPSRCLFYFCGNFPLEGHLDFIAKHALDEAEAAPSLPKLPHQKRFDSPKRIVSTYPISGEESAEDKCFIAFGWLTTDLLHQEELLALCIIESALMDTDASPLKKALLRSGMCAHPTIYIDTDISEVPVLITLKGCREKDADALESLLKETLRKIAEEGIPKQIMENAIHQLEFHRSEIGGDSHPFGLTLYMRSALLKHHGAQPEEGLKVHTLVDSLLEKLSGNTHYFEKLITKYFVENDHFVRLVMVPDPDLAQREVEEEMCALEEIKKKLTPEEASAIVEQARELKAFQDEQDEEDPSILPSVDLSDVPKHCRDIPLQTDQDKKLAIFYHEAFTNGIVYTDLIWDFPATNEEDLWLTRLYGNLLTQMGSGGRSYSETLDYIHAHTGGVGTSIGLNNDAYNHHIFQPTLHLRGKALDRKADKLFPLLLDIKSGADFTDRARFKEAFIKHFNIMQSSLTDRAMKYATQLAASNVHEAIHFQQALFGLDYYLKIRDYAVHYEKYEHELLEKIIAMQEHLSSLDQPHLLITCGRKTYDSLKGNHFYGLNNLDMKPIQPWEVRPLSVCNLLQGKVIASPVAFTAKAMTTVSYVDKASPALSLAANIFDNTFLHRKLREEGGAYGGGASFNSLSGNFIFYSYRDPHIFSTLKAFDEAVLKVMNGDIDDSDLEEAKLERIQDFDSPISPGSMGDVAYGWFREKKTRALRQEFRDRLIAVTKEEIIEAVAVHIAPQMEHAPTVVFAGKELLDKENLLLMRAGKRPIPYTSI